MDERVRMGDWVSGIVRAVVPVAVVVGMLLSPAVTVAAPWAPAAPMDAARSSHAAAVLADGDVLVVGGMTHTGTTLASAERFDAATGTWSPAGSLTTARGNATATTLPDGTVLVVGGSAGGSIASAERYDPQTNSWSPAGALTTARHAHQALLLADGTVLVAGGMGGAPLASAERYDPQTNSWSPAAPMSVERALLSLTALQDGTVLAAGGFNNSFTTVTSERYDPVTDSWSPAGSMTQPRSAHNAVRLPDGDVLVVGSNISDARLVERYDPASDAWSVAGSTTVTRNGTMTLLPNGMVLLAGTPGSGNVGATELFDPATGRAFAAGTLRWPRSVHTATTLPDGSVLVAGGYVGATATATVERFSFVTSVAAPPVDFGEQAVGGLGPVVSVPVRNDGGVPLLVGGAAIAGAQASDFSLAWDRCTGAGWIPAGESCLVGVRFRAGAAGARSASLMLAAGVVGGRAAIPLSGVGVAARAAARPRRVRCSARRGSGIRCSGLPARLASARGSVVLSRGGTVFARGRIARGTLTLSAQRRLRGQRYRLTIGRGRAAKRSTIAIA